jgi:hypothetical protein
MYTCNCGRQFETQRSLNSHARFCEKYEKISKKTSQYKIDEKIYRCECGKEYDNHQSLNAHFSHCLIHRNGVPTIRKYQHQKGIMHGWEKFSKEEIEEIHSKAGKSYSKNIKSGKTVPSFKNKHHSIETKQKMSSSNDGRNNGYVKTKYYEVFCPYENKMLKVQGTWELKYANYLNENNVNWTKSKKINLKYKLFNTDYWHTYYPDFYLIETQEYIEVKGYWWKSNDGRVDDKRKMKMVKKYNPDKKIRIITKIK